MFALSNWLKRKIQFVGSFWVDSPYTPNQASWFRPKLATSHFSTTQLRPRHWSAWENWSSRLDCTSHGVHRRWPGKNGHPHLDPWRIPWSNSCLPGPLVQVPEDLGCLKLPNLGKKKMTWFRWFMKNYEKSNNSKYTDYTGKNIYKTHVKPIWSSISKASGMEAETLGTSDLTTMGHSNFVSTGVVGRVLGRLRGVTGRLVRGVTGLPVRCGVRSVSKPSRSKPVISKGVAVGVLGENGGSPNLRKRDYVRAETC